MTKRWFCLFTSSFRYDAAPNISHETIDKVRTLCGRKVDDAATLEDDDREHAMPDYRICSRAVERMRKSEPEAAITCETCAPGHRPGSLQPKCGVNGCECWCNR